MKAEKDKLPLDPCLEELCRRCTGLSEKGFSVNLARAEEEWLACFRSLGLSAACRAMAHILCGVYLDSFGREYLFSEDCLGWEIEYHVRGYYWARGYEGFPRSVTMLAFSRDQLISHCKEIDISTDDVSDLRQRSVFDYYHGIRDCYRNTDLDPWRGKR